MIKLAMLKRGDKIAIVSLSWGGLGDENFIQKNLCVSNKKYKQYCGN